MDLGVGVVEGDCFAEGSAAGVDGEGRGVGVDDEAVVDEGRFFGEVDLFVGFDAGEGGDFFCGDCSVVYGEVVVCGEGCDCAGDCWAARDIPVAFGGDNC